MSRGIFNVTDFGAAGDGMTKDTESLQRAIDACAASGGGVVMVPAGTYLSGTLYLKSHVELHLSAGATLLGSPDREDYNPVDVFPENSASERDHTTGTHLIIAYRQENVAITGQGTINGNSPVFFGKLPVGKVASYRYKTGNYEILSWRPAQMVFFCRCRNVHIQDVSLVNAPYWTLFFHGCENVRARGLTVVNPPATRNGDGIDIDCSRNVTVSDCLIETGDDCITLRGNKVRLGDEEWPCERVTVTNCVLRTPCNAIRVGVGNGTVRDCTFSNIVVAESRTAISINSSYTPDSPGVCIERIRFSDFLIDAINPFVVHPGPGAEKPAAIRDIDFSRMRVTATAGAQLSGTPKVPLERIRFADVDWTATGGSDNPAFAEAFPEQLSIHGYLGLDDGPALPGVLNGVHVRDLEFRNVRVRWREPKAAWRYGFVLEESEQVRFFGVTVRQPQKDDGAAIYCRRTKGLTVHACTADDGTGTFVLVRESGPGARVRWIANDVYAASVPLAIDADVVSDEQHERLSQEES